MSQPGYAIEVVVDDRNRCGEAPTWDAQRQRLVWTDIERGLVFEFFPATEQKSILNRDLTVSGIALNRTGELVFGGAGGLHLWKGQGHYRTIVAEHKGVTLCFNDIIADPQGRIYGGTIYWGLNGMERRGDLYLIDGNGEAHVVDEGVELANGLGFSPDNRILYFADSAARCIHSYDVDSHSGALRRKRVFVRVPSDQGIPDGLTVDREGFVWCALWYGAQIVRYDPDGTVERRIRLPVTQVSSLSFGGKDLTELFITSASEPWRSQLAPSGFNFNWPDFGGELFRVRLQIQGKAEHLAELR